MGSVTDMIQPPSLPPVLRDQGKADAEHLKLLAIFHYVGAGLAVIGLLFLCGHYVLMHAVLANPALWEKSKAQPPPPQLLGMLRWFYLFGAVVLVGSGVANLLSARFLQVRKHRVFSLVVAGLNCIHIPLGAALGVFTFIVLLRDSVRQLYAAPK